MKILSQQNMTDTGRHATKTTEDASCRPSCATLFLLYLSLPSPPYPLVWYGETDLHDEEVHKLKLLLQYVRVVEGNLTGLAGPHLIIEHANVHIQSGTGGTGDGGNPSARAT